MASVSRANKHAKSKEKREQQAAEFGYRVDYLILTMVVAQRDQGRLS
jgi:hypothetical protein